MIDVSGYVCETCGEIVLDKPAECTYCQGNKFHELDGVMLRLFRNNRFVSRDKLFTLVKILYEQRKLLVDPDRLRRVNNIQKFLSQFLEDPNSIIDREKKRLLELEVVNHE